MIEGSSVADAVDRGVEVAERHRDVLLGLRGIVQTLISKVEGVLEGTESCVLVPVKSARGEAAGPKVAFDVLGERDSVADTVVKLTGVLAKLIPMERQAFYLEGKIDPKELSDEQIIRLLSGDLDGGSE